MALLAQTDSRKGKAARAGAVLLALALAAGLGPLSPETGRAQVKGPDGAYHHKDQAFYIPFSVDAGDRRIQQVLLYVSDNQGVNWQQAGTAKPGDEKFLYRAPRDGFYYFTVRTQDPQGRFNPPTLDQNTPPMIRVWVDTLPPTVVLRPLGSRDGLAGVEWQVRDEFLDLDSLRLDYRQPGGNQWLPANAERAASGKFTWNLAGGPLEVRLQVKDRAGNQAEGTTVIGDPGGGGGHDGLGVRWVNSKQVKFNFEVSEKGTSGVAAVELWMTKPSGKKWEKYPNDLQGEQSPFVFEVDEEGLYGFILLARSGVGLRDQEPRPGDKPQLQVQVDWTLPKVEIKNVVVGRGTDSGRLSITWLAQDKHLVPMPIAISYAEPGGPWLPIQKGLANSGSFVWKLPESPPPKVNVRVEAVDFAGNVGSAETAKEVIVDLSQPKVRVLGVESAGKQ